VVWAGREDGTVVDVSVRNALACVSGRFFFFVSGVGGTDVWVGG